MLVGIYSMEKNIMEVINSFHIDKAHEGRKNKQRVIEVEVARVEKQEKERRKKSHQSRKPRRVTFEYEGTPNEYVGQNSSNEVITPSHKTNKQEKCKIAIPRDDSIHIDYK
jgi:hypothetical protein